MQLISTVPFYETPAVGDLEAREILSTLVDVADEEANMLTMLEYIGAIEGTDNKQFFSYTNTFLYDSIQVAAAGTGTATLAGGSVTLVSGHGSRVRKGSIIMNAAKDILYVSAVSGDVITVKRLDTAAGDVTLANDEVLSVPSNAVGEGSSNGNMKERPLVKRSNQIQIFENGDSVSDLFMAGKTVLTLPDGSQYYFYKWQDDMYKKHRTDIANNHLVGQFGESTDADGNVVYFSRGLDRSITDLGGVSLQTAGVGALNKADFATWNRALDLARSPKKGMLAVGGDMNVFIDDTFDTILADGAVDYGMWGSGSNAAKAAELGIKNFTVYGRTFEKAVLPQMDHKFVTAIAGFEYPDLAYFLPQGSVKGEGGDSAPYIRGRYLKFADESYINGRFHEKIFGGLAPQGATSADNTLEVRYTSYEAFEANGTEHMGRFKIQR